MTGTPAPLLLLTDRSQARFPVADVVRAAIAGGARAVLLREKDLGWAERCRLARELLVIVEDAGGTLLVASDPDLPGHGVHLAAADPWPELRPPMVGRSCHDGIELGTAEAEGVDYVTLSPVFATGSKPGYGPPLGIAGFGALARSCARPVYALGGVTPERTASLLAAGAAGVAVMGGVMGAPDPAAAVRCHLDELARAR